MEVAPALISIQALTKRAFFRLNHSDKKIPTRKKSHVGLQAKPSREEDGREEREKMTC